MSWKWKQSWSAMRHLCDSNVFVALTVSQHSAHDLTRRWLGTLVTGDSLGLCRLSQMSFLRLLTQRIAEGYVPATNEEAAEKLREWKRLAYVEDCAEPAGTEPDWLRLAGSGRDHGDGRLAALQRPTTPVADPPSR